LNSLSCGCLIISGSSFCLTILYLLLVRNYSIFFVELFNCGIVELFFLQFNTSTMPKALFNNSTLPTGTL
jgi:hypothetical protein